MAVSEEVYLGDGLYASFDGWQIRLRAPRGFLGDHEVYLDPGVLTEFENFVGRLRGEAKSEASDAEKEKAAG